MMEENLNNLQELAKFSKENLSWYISTLLSNPEFLPIELPESFQAVYFTYGFAVFGNAFGMKICRYLKAIKMIHTLMQSHF